MREWVVFSIENQLFTVDLESVDSVVNAVELTSVPLAPEVYKGMLDYHGELMPVFDIRHWLGFTSRELKLSDQFVVCKYRGRFFALCVDAVAEIGRYQEDLNASVPEVDAYSGVIKMEGETVLILKMDPLFDRTELARV